MTDRSVELLVEPRRLRTSLDRRKFLDPNVASSASPGQKGLDLGKFRRQLPMTLLIK